MNKGGFIKILIKGRQNRKARDRFETDWLGYHDIADKEKASCCYAFFYDHKRNTVMDMVMHCTTTEHIIKLTAKLGFESEYLRREVRHYTKLILEGKL